MDVRSWILLVGWLVGWWLLWRVPLVGEGRDGRRRAGRDLGSGGSIGGDDRTMLPSTVALGCSVIVPARNEETSLQNLLESLRRQRVRADEVIVVDDQSDDDTARIAEACPGVQLVSGTPVPAGWTGKAWACHQGVQRSSGDVFVFLDADVVLAPDALEVILDARRDRGGLVSVQPFHLMRRAYERLSALFNVLGTMGVGSASPGRGGSARGAFGPVLATGRTEYDLIGGHRSVRGDIVEDIALARCYRSAGFPVHAFGGGEIVSFRMYPDGLGQLVEGWSKNFATGASSVAPLRLFLIGFWLTCVLVSVQSVIEALVGTSSLGWFQLVATYALFAFQIGAMLRQLGNFGSLTAAMYPGPVGIFLVVFAASVYLTLFRRRVRWRGRSVSLSGARRWSQAAVRTDE